MTVRECYEELGENYDEVLRRLGREGQIRKLLGMLVRDPNIEQIHEALGAEDFLRAFQCAHTLKGVYLNMGLMKLAGTASELTDELRDATEIGNAQTLFETLFRYYGDMKSAVAKLDE